MTLYRKWLPKPSPQKKICKKAKCLSEKASQIAKKKKEKGKEKGKDIPN